MLQISIFSFFDHIETALTTNICIYPYGHQKIVYSWGFLAATNRWQCFTYPAVSLVFYLFLKLPQISCQKVGRFGQIFGRQRAQNVSQMAINCMIWPHWFLAKADIFNCFAQGTLDICALLTGCCAWWLLAPTGTRDSKKVCQLDSVFNQ